DPGLPVAVPAARAPAPLAEPYEPQSGRHGAVVGLPLGRQRCARRCLPPAAAPAPVDQASDAVRYLPQPGAAAGRLAEECADLRPMAATRHGMVTAAGA